MATYIWLENPRYIELLNFGMEVMYVLQTRTYELMMIKNRYHKNLARKEGTAVNKNIH